MIKNLKYSIVLLPLTLLIYFISSTLLSGVGTWGMNKTIGWAWDVNIHLPFIVALLFSVLSYVILILLQYIPNKALSVFNGILLILTATTYFLRDGMWFLATILGSVLIIIICFVNTIVATYNKAQQ